MCACVRACVCICLSVYVDVLDKYFNDYINSINISIQEYDHNHFFINKKRKSQHNSFRIRVFFY